jgi:hypothetical protein
MRKAFRRLWFSMEFFSGLALAWMLDALIDGNWFLMAMMGICFVVGVYRVKLDNSNNRI